MSVPLAYGLLGATWLNLKVEGELQKQAARITWWLGAATLAAIGLVSLATPFLAGDYFDRWLSFPNILWVAPVPVLLGIASLAFVRSLKSGGELAPFLLTLSIFLLCFIGLGITVFPYVIPDSVTIWQAATDRSSQVFMLVGTAVVMPMILGYTAWSYWGVSRQGPGRRLSLMKLPRLRWPDIGAPRKGDSPAPLGMRLLWMAGVWATSILVLLAVAMLLRFVLAR